MTLHSEVKIMKVMARSIVLDDRNRILFVSTGEAKDSDLDLPEGVIKREGRQNHCKYASGKIKSLGSDFQCKIRQLDIVKLQMPSTTMIASICTNPTGLSFGYQDKVVWLDLCDVIQNKSIANNIQILTRNAFRSYIMDWRKFNTHLSSLK